MTDALIHPRYGHRFNTSQIRGSYGSLEEAFERGDYNLVAELADPGSELKACATVLCGFVEPGRRALRSAPKLGSIGLLTLGFAEWWAGDTAAALQALRSLPSNDPLRLSADRLAMFVASERIPVWITAVALPIFTSESSNDRRPVQRFGPFEAKMVGTALSDNAYEFAPHHPFDAFLEGVPEADRPAFTFAMTPQWFMPLNYDKAKVPKLLWCHDSDYFLSRSYDNFRIHDVVITATSQEHFEISRGCGAVCASNVMSDTLCGPSKPSTSESQIRDIDVLFTGSSLSAFHTEKARFIYHLSRLTKDFNVVIVDGHLPEDQYFELLRRAKFLPIINRYAGQPSPRWRDALMNQTMLLYPEGTPFGQISRGAFPYRPDAIEADIRHHLERYVQAQPGSAYHRETAFQEVERDLAFVRESREKQFERQLKFCAFLVALKGRRASLPQDARRRWVWPVPTVDRHLFGHQHVVDTVETIADSIDDSGLADDIDYNAAAQLYRQLCCVVMDAIPRKPDWDARIRDFVGKGRARFPRSLLLRLGEALWERFDKNGNEGRAIELLESIVADFDSLDFEPLGADFVFGYAMMLAEQVFPDFEYGEQVVRHAVLSRNPDIPADPDVVHPRVIVHAGIHAYLANLYLRRAERNKALDHMRRSWIIFPQNQWLVKTLIQELDYDAPRNRDHAHAIAEEILSAFHGAANQYPAMLLTHLPIVLRHLNVLGRTNEIRNLADAWGGLARCMHFLGAYVNPGQDQAKIRELLGYVDYFPDDLVSAISRSAPPQRLRSFLSEDVAPNYRLHLYMVGTRQARSDYVMPTDTAEFMDALIAATDKAERLEREIVHIQNSEAWRLALKLRWLIRKFQLPRLKALAGRRN